VVLNIYNTVHTYSTKKSGTITGKAAILEPQFQTNIWVASVDATQKRSYTFLVRGLLNETGGWYQITLVNMLCDISRKTIEMALRFQFVNSEYIYERIKEFDFD